MRCQLYIHKLYALDTIFAELNRPTKAAVGAAMKTMILLMLH